MRVLQALLGAGAMLALAATASAETLFDKHQRMCASPAGALTLAQAEGWMTYPKGLVPPMPPSLDLRNVEVRLLSDANTMAMLVVGDGSTEMGGKNFAVDFCALAQFPVQPDLSSMLEQRLDLKPMAVLSSGTVYGYVERNGKRRAVKPSDLSTGAGAVLLMTGQRDNMSMILAMPLRREDAL